MEEILHHSSPLLVAELLSIVLSYLEDDAVTLARAVCVCRLWFHSAYPLLWKSPPIQAVSALAPSRCQLYADEITSLKVFYAEGIESADQLQGINFPHLCKLWLSSMFVSISGSLNHLILPSLKMIRMEARQISSKFLDHLLASCTDLKAVELTCFDRTPDWDSVFVRRLLNYFKLVDIALDIPYIDPSVLSGSFNRKSLLRVRIGPTKFRPFFAPVCHGTEVALDDIASSVVHFSGALYPPSISKFINAGLSLKTLVLNYNGSPVDLMDSLQHMDTLTGLSLWFSEGMLTFEALRSLRHLSSLETLIISGTHYYGPNEGMVLHSQINNSQFLECIQFLSNLHRLYFSVTSRISMSSLENIGRLCPAIEEILFLGTFNLNHINDASEECLFPSLNELWLSKATLHNSKYSEHGLESQPSKASKVLQKHAPNLKELMIGDDDVSLEIRKGFTGFDKMDLGDKKYSDMLLRRAIKATEELWASTDTYAF